ncbi:hypothetical protein [Streptomyces avicenniae]|uniref:hypothetical protein n=1 Tax=Streptomyces avicenniae TaxID=500153 RepID=UPI000B2424BD|nr:hypothetical protein [Streptomyces avicenniae]
MEIVAIAGVLGLTFLVFAMLVVRGTRAVRRGVDTARREVRRTVSDVKLTARAAQPGIVGELSRVRKELRASLDSTRITLQGGATDDPALGEALTLFGQLEAHARQLDGELTTLAETEPDRARIAARLPELRDRVTRVRHSADALRFAAQDRARRHDSLDADDLHERIGMEAEALRHWAPTGETPPPVEPGAARPELPGRLRKRRPR